MYDPVSDVSQSILECCSVRDTLHVRAAGGTSGDYSLNSIQMAMKISGYLSTFPSTQHDWEPIIHTYIYR